MGYMQNYKRTYLDTEIAYRKEGITFIPLVSEADGGGWGPAGQAVWKELAKQKSIVSGKPDSITAGHLLQTLGIILNRENARVILHHSLNNYSENNQEFRALLAASVAYGTAADAADRYHRTKLILGWE